MEEGGATLQLTTLRQLQQLTNLAKGIAKIHQTTDDNRDELQQLRTRLAGLKRRKHELERESAAKRTVYSLINDKINQKSYSADENINGSNNSSSSNANANVRGGGGGGDVDLNQLAELNEKLKDAMDMSVASRVAGVSAFAVENDNIGLRFETFYRGKFCECYYVVLAFSQEEGGESIVVDTHTLPLFVPIRQLVRKYLNSNISVFVEAVNSYLDPYIARREQVKEVIEIAKQRQNNNNNNSNNNNDDDENDAHGLKIASSKSYDLIEIVKGTTSVKLIFDDLASDIPRRALVVNTATQRRLKLLETVFLSSNILQSVTKAFFS